MSTIARKLDGVQTTAGLGSFMTTFDTEPFEYYERLRERGDLVWDEEQQVWIASTYAALKEIGLADKVKWGDPFGRYDPAHPPFGVAEDDWRDYIGGATVLQQVDDDLHNTMHRWWMRTLSPKVLQLWGETLVDPIIAETIRELFPDGKVDSNEFVQVITLRSVAAVLGLPHDMEWLQLFSATGLRLLAIFSNSMKYLDPAQAAANPEDIKSSLAGSVEFQSMIMEHVKAKKPVDGATQDPTEAGLDFIRLIWETGDQLFGTTEFSDIDVRGHAFQAVIASLESINSAARNGFYLLATHPELHDVIRSDPRAAQNFVQEVLRLHGSVEFRSRRALEDIEVQGTLVKQGEMVVCVIGSANRDPKKYEDPYELKLDRPSPRDHFGFFQGPRMCAGQNLARFLLEHFFVRTLDQIYDLRLDPEAPRPRYSGSLIRRWDPVKILFTPPES